MSREIWVTRVCHSIVSERNNIHKVLAKENKVE